MQVAINGYDYTDPNDNTVFTFLGTASLFIYWPYIIGVILGLLAIIALIICCSAVIEKSTESDIKESRGHKKPSVGGLGGRPHTLRDEFGFYRTRGFFQEHSQSPAPGARGTSVYNPQSSRMKSVMPSPGSVYI